MNNATADKGLRDRAAKLRSLSRVLTAEVLRNTVKRFEALVASDISAQRAPDGTPWTPTQDGHPALQNAAKAVQIRTTGGSVVLSVEGVEWRHNVGAVNGGRRRALIPSGELPKSYADAVDQEVRIAFSRALR